MTIEAIIFDFDGLLMDTERCSLASWQHVWAQHGLELDLSTFWPTHSGDVSEERYGRLAEAVGPSFDRDACHTTRLAYRDDLNASLGFRPGIEAWLRRGGEIGMRMAIASGSHREWVTTHLARVGCLNQFELLACGDETSGHKPDPAIYQLALERLGVAPESAVAVEDTPHGVLAATAAGMRCVAIPNLYPYPADFTQAAVVLESAADISIDVLLETLSGATPQPTTHVDTGIARR